MFYLELSKKTNTTFNYKDQKKHKINLENWVKRKWRHTRVGSGFELWGGRETQITASTNSDKNLDPRSGGSYCLH